MTPTWIPGSIRTLVKFMYIAAERFSFFGTILFVEPKRWMRQAAAEAAANLFCSLFPNTLDQLFVRLEPGAQTPLYFPVNAFSFFFCLVFLFD